jgi:hypothetical protein
MSLGVNQLIGFGAGGAVTPASVTLTDNSVDSVNRTAYTFSSQSLGAAAANRKIIVVIFSAGVTGGRTLNSVTVAGSSASKLVGISSGEKINEIWVLDLASGTTGDVVVTYSASKGQCGIGVYRLLTGATAAHATASVVATGPSTTLDVPASGIAILGTGYDSGATTAVTLTGVTEVYDEEIESGIHQTGGLVALPGGETGRTMASVGTASSAGSATLVCASYGP